MEPTREETRAALDQLIPCPPFDSLWYMAEADLLSVQRILRLHDSYGSWTQSPRLYTMLHMLQCDDAVLAQFQRANINDFWLPIDGPTLARLGIKIKGTEFLQIQQHVLSDPIYMSNLVLLETTHVHRHLKSGDEHLLEMEHINDGASSRVFRVQHKTSGKTFACKRAPRGVVRHQQERLRLFLQEMDILRRIDHPHIIRLIASYTDMDTFALVLHPVAEESLKSMLNRTLSVAELSVLRQSFGCLISALVYLHEDRQVRHKDIKPENILLDHGRIYLCDFGISLDWSDIGKATTDGKPFQRTIGYCAPEVISWHSRNNASDIWSLGRVFCDMITVIKGRSLSEMLEHIGGGLPGIYDNPEAMRTWLLELRDEDSYSTDNLPLVWAQDMIATKSSRRPTASTMAARMLAETSDLTLSHTYVAPCCRVHLKDMPSRLTRRILPIDSLQSLSRTAVSVTSQPFSLSSFSAERLRSLIEDQPNREAEILTIATLLRTLIKLGEYQLSGTDDTNFVELLNVICLNPAEKEKKNHKEGSMKVPIRFKDPIKFKDAVCRKFLFPWHICNTWKGIEDLIKEAFLHVDVIGPHVYAGHYDLVGPDGEIVLPQVWEALVQPGWSITMHMWPMPEPPPSPRSAPQPSQAFPGSQTPNSFRQTKREGDKKDIKVDRPRSRAVINMDPTRRRRFELKDGSKS